MTGKITTESRKNNLIRDVLRGKVINFNQADLIKNLNENILSLNERKFLILQTIFFTVYLLLFRGNRIYVEVDDAFADICYDTDRRRMVFRLCGLGCELLVGLSR